MYENTKKVDLRSVRTEKALDMAMVSLLSTRNFRKITVKDISDEALVSRAAFYTHFNDKYDFLRVWLVSKTPRYITVDEPYESIEWKINQFVYDNKAIIKNLLNDIDEETMGVIRDCILSSLDLSLIKTCNGSVSPKYIVLSNFYTGGILTYFLWQVKNNFPSDVAPMNIYLFEAIEMFQGLKN